MARKGENIYKRKDGRWEGRYIKTRTQSGKVCYGYVYAKTYRETKLKLAAAMTQEKTELSYNSNSNESPLFGEFAQDWLEHISPKIKESSYNKYRNMIALYLCPTFGEIPLHLLTHDRIETGCNDLLQSGGQNGTGLSQKTVYDTLSLIRRILNHAIQLGERVSCDGRSVKIKQGASEMRVLSRREQDCLHQYLSSHPTSSNLGILISLFTGLRIGEICALRWEDISLSEGTLYVHQTMQRIQDHSESKKKTKVVITSPKSLCSIRSIPIPSELVQMIADSMTVPTGFFLTNSDTYMEPRTMQNRFKKVLKACSIDPANYHALRHTFATRCIELGFDVKSLSEILGHATVNITMNRYVHPSMELKKENMSRLSVLFAVK